MESFKSNYPYIYNTEVVEEDEENETVNLNFSEFQEFQEHYGGYMEIIYLITQGNLMRMDEILEADANSILFKGEYLKRKADIERKSNKNK